MREFHVALLQLIQEKLANIPTRGAAFLEKTSSSADFATSHPEAFHSACMASPAATVFPHETTDSCRGEPFDTKSSMQSTSSNMEAHSSLQSDVDGHSLSVNGFCLHWCLYLYEQWKPVYIFINFSLLVLFSFCDRLLFTYVLHRRTSEKLQNSFVGFQWETMTLWVCFPIMAWLKFVCCYCCHHKDELYACKNNLTRAVYV